MATEPAQTQSIHERIAALNLGEVGRAPITAKPTRVQLPQRQALQDRRGSSSVLPSQGLGSSTTKIIGNEPNAPKSAGVLPPPTIIRTSQVVPPSPRPAVPPQLPARTTSTQRPPALLPRKPFEQLSRRDSNESIGSTISTVSSISTLSDGTRRTSTSRTPSIDGGRIRAPVYDPSTLPPLPPKRTSQEKEKERNRISFKTTKSTPSVTTVEVLPPSSTPVLPPRPPPRKETAVRKLTSQPPQPVKSALSFGFNKPDDHVSTNCKVNGPFPASTLVPAGQAPPPVPLSSRPDLSKVQATNPIAQTTSSSRSCLKCRDFSAPDTHAATFPRHAVPSLDWLATQLTSPFPSLTDKARAIFTWLHHNISYYVVAFFDDALQPSTPASTLSTGLAVCEGYAALFAAIASKAGLESIVVSGHGKGFGFSSLSPGTPVPAESTNHAWNAVKIDNGEWKLIDCCWGAGNVSGKGKPYNKAFTPTFFIMDNNDFGLRHFPTNGNYFFRTDGRDRISWAEYILGDQGGELTTVYGAANKEGLNETAFLPRYLKIPVAPSQHPTSTLRFQFEKICSHWDPVRNGSGKPYVYVLAIHGQDGREDDLLPLESNGMYWWLDVPIEKLGARGQTLNAYFVETVDGKGGRGLSVAEFRAAKGRKGMGFGGVAVWDLV